MIANNTNGLKDMVKSIVDRDTRIEKMTQEVEEMKELNRVTKGIIEDQLSYDRPVAVKLRGQLVEVIRPFKPEVASDKIIIRPLQIVC